MNRNAAITQSYATGGVIGKDKVGGLVGYTDVHGTIMQAYATGSVSGINSNVGGLVGNNFLGTMTQAYATGSVSGLDNAGGLVGYNAGTITQSYVTGGVSTQNSVGGLVGYDGGSAVTDSYWDIETSGQSSGVGGTGLTTAEARQASSYAGWDFTNVWFQSGDMRLILRSEAATPVNGVTTITNLHQLALVGANLSGSYVLGANIDASASAGADAAGIRSAKGFVPIGPAYATGAVSGGNIVGGLIGQNYGAVNQAYASGSVSGGGQSGASSAKTTERSIRHMQRGRSARLEARVASSATTTLPLHRATWMRRRAGW